VELTAKIIAALPKQDANGQRVVQPIKVDRGGWGKMNPELQKMSPEEQRTWMFRRN
jgi:hypothetical protein